MTCNDNREHVWPEDFDNFQSAFDAAVSRGAELRFRPNVTYTWPMTTVTVNGTIKVVATGARIEVPGAVLALHMQTGADASEVDGGHWIYTGPLTNGYNGASNAIRVTGTRNGPGVAPTFIENVKIKNATFEGFGNVAVEYQFARNCSDENIRCLRCGYAGVFTYSVDIYRSTGLFLNTLAGQLETGSPSTSELNAYGFVATAKTDDTPDRIQDPCSRDIVVESPTMLNIPTWHAIDSHGSDAMVVQNATMTNCRRGVVFTGLSDKGTTNSTALGCIANNNFSASDTNANGTSKKGEAFWDIGPAGSAPNSFNRFQECIAFGHGNPNGDEGAVTIANANDGFYGISDEQSQRVGWKFGSNISRATICARTTDVRHASVNPSVARVDGNDIDLRVARWRSDARNASVDVNVMVNGIVITSTNSGGTIFFEDFDLTACTNGELVPSSGNSISAVLNGNYSIVANLTMTGVCGAVVEAARFVRQGRLCLLQLPAASFAGTSTAASLTLTGVPVAFRPSGTTPAGTVAAVDGVGNFVLAFALVDSAGVITLTRDGYGDTSSWTSNVMKGLRGGILQWIS